MKVFFFIFCFTGLTYGTIAQNWQWAKNIDKKNQELGSSIGTDKQGNVYVCGATFYYTGGGGSFYYPLLLKFNSSGNLLWTDTLPFPCNKSITDSVGNTYLVSGNFIAKYDSSGQKLWVKNVPGGFFRNISLNPLGCFVVIGSTYVAGKCVSALYSFDQNANILWNRIGDFPSGGSTPNTITCDNYGNTYLAGEGKTDSATGNFGFLAKYNINGGLILNKIVPHTPNDISTDTGEGIYVSGYYGYTYPININGIIYSSPSSVDIYQYLIKYDRLGNVIWYKIITGALSQENFITVDNEKNVYLATAYTSLTVDNYTLNNFPSSGDVVIMKTDSIGNISWITTSLSGSNQSSAFPKDILINSCNEILITGAINGSHSLGSTTLSVSGYSDILIAKLSQPDVSSITQSASKNAVFTIFPNPSSGIFTINYSSQEKGGLEVKITNVRGQIIFTESIPHFTAEYAIDIDLSKYAKGIYFVEIVADRKRTIRKLVLD